MLFRSGQLVEQAGHILADHRIAGQQAEIGVDTGGLRVVVTGAHMAEVAIAAVTPVLPENQEEARW